MQKNDEQLLGVLKEIRNWIRAAALKPVKALLEEALPDQKSRNAYQMFDGRTSAEQIRVACKISPNAVVSLGLRCASLGLIEINADKKRVRLFDLNDFGMIRSADNEKGTKRVR